MKNIFFSLFLLISHFGISMTPSTTHTKQTVIATKGLHLRESAGLSSKIITTIPFLEKVDPVFEAITQTDTISTMNFRDYDGNIYEDYITGEWIKVKYNGEEGYVFNAYLLQGNDYQSTENVNDVYGITFVGLDCVENIHRNKDIQWKGVFKEGDQFEIRDVHISYYLYQDEEYGAFGTSTEENEDLLFLVGNENDQFNNHQINGKYYTDEWVFDYDQDSSSFENLKLQRDDYSTYLTISEDGIDQKMEVYGVVQLMWKGDLDGDGKNDYILTYGEAGTSTVLYLSSEAEGNQLVKPVAEYYSGYCC